MKAIAGLLLAISLALLLAACSKPPSSQELFDRASQAAEQQASSRYQVKLSGAATVEGQEQGGGITISGSSDLENDDNSTPNLQFRAGQVTVSQIDEAVYLQSKQGTIKVPAEDNPNRVESKSDQEQINDVVSQLGKALLGAVNEQSKISKGPEIAGQKTWAWEPELSELDYQQLLNDGLVALFQLAENNRTLQQELGDNLEQEKKKAEESIKGISPETLDKIKTAVSGVDVKAYFGQDSGLNLGVDIQIGWDYQQLAEVFGADALGSADQSTEIEAQVEYRSTYSDQPLQLTAPSDAKRADSPAGQKIISDLLADTPLAALGIGALFGPQVNSALGGQSTLDQGRMPISAAPSGD
jgi:hypothetical protein